jgi:hypothetical protein
MTLFMMTYLKEIRKQHLLEMHLFALVNPVTKPRIVLIPILYISLFFKQVPIGDILKHEQIHIGQYSRTIKTYYLNLKTKSHTSIKMKLWHLPFQ